jgi:hypothetical protein
MGKADAQIEFDGDLDLVETAAALPSLDPNEW